MPKRYFSNRRRLGARRRMYARKRYGLARSKRLRFNRRLVTVGHLHRALSREREDKVASRLIAYGVEFNQTITAPGDIYPIMPRISQGTGSYQRVGRQIRTRYMYVNLMVTCSPDYGLTTNNPIIYRILFLTWKQGRTELRLDQAPMNQLLLVNDDTGAALNIGYTGQSDVHMMPVNTNVFTVIRDIRGKFYPNDNDTNPASAEQNPLPGICRQHRVRIKLPKTLLYDLAATNPTGDTPTNYAPFMCAGWCYPNNINAGITETKLKITARSYMMFEDP